jgi:hypothetical protein
VKCFSTIGAGDKVREPKRHALCLEEHMVLFNKYHLGEVVYNLQTNVVGTIVGYRETAETVEYEVLIHVELNNVKFGASLELWPESALETSTATDSRTN